MKKSFEDSVKIYGKEIKNRIVLQPMEDCDGTKESAIDKLTIVIFNGKHSVNGEKSFDFLSR